MITMATTAQICHQCLEFLKIKRSQAQILQAIENHNLIHMKQKEDQSKKFRSNAEGLRFVTDGAVGKGKEQLTIEQMNRLVTATQIPLTRLGYLEADQSGVPSGDRLLS